MQRVINPWNRHSRNVVHSGNMGKFKENYDEWVAVVASKGGMLADR